MKFLKTVLGLAAAAVLVPYSIKVEGEEKKTVTVDSLLCHLEATPCSEGTPGEVKITLPAEGMKKIIAFVKEKAPVVKEKAVAVAGKVVEAKDKAVDAAVQLGGKAQETAVVIRDKAQATAAVVRDKAQAAATIIRDKAQDVVDGVRSKVASLRGAAHEDTPEVVIGVAVEDAPAVEMPVAETPVEEAPAPAPKKRASRKKAEPQA